MDSNTKKRLEPAFRFFDTCLGDLEKVLNCNPSGFGPNFVAASLSLIITEPIAKICFPYILYKRRGSSIKEERLAFRRKRTNRRVRKNNKSKIPRCDYFDDVLPKPSVKKLWARHFTNKRYVELHEVLWDSFRNKIVHMFVPAKFDNVGIKEIDGSFLSGASWPGTLKIAQADRNNWNRLKDNHITFQKAYNKRNKLRPYIVFIPHIYYEDLFLAVQNIKKETQTNSSLRQRIVTGWELYTRSYKVDFSNDLQDSKTKNQIVKELNQLVNS